MKFRVYKLNRRVFKRNLKAVLRDDLKKSLDIYFENWVNDYEYRICCYGRDSAGWYTVQYYESASGHSEHIRTN